MDVGCCPSLPSNGLDADEPRPNVHIAVYTTASARRSALCRLFVQFINIGILTSHAAFVLRRLSCIGQDHRSCQALSAHPQITQILQINLCNLWMDLYAIDSFAVPSLPDISLPAP